MSKKKQTQPSISQGENEQAQSMLAQYHQIATQLHACTDEQQVKAALAELNNMPEGVQIALLKALAKEQQTDAADVLAALYAFGTLKEARKEARRSLIRLEGAKIYPRWEAPLVSPVENSSLQVATPPPRFFKGLVTDSYDTGEVQLILSWEMGEDYHEVRMLGFLLEFWHDGIKDFFTSLESKRSFANLLSQMHNRLGYGMLKECTLDEGILLLEEAKSVNVKHGTKAHKDYTRHLALINQLIPENLALQVVGSINAHNREEEAEEEIDLSTLDPQDVVAQFIEGGVEGDLGLAYQILAQDSPLREGLTLDEWVERREDWADKFIPMDIEPNLLYTREQLKPKIWLPAFMNKASSDTTQEVEAGWSVELEEIVNDETELLPELPKPLIIYATTKRHWFWASFTLVRENDAWHIQNMTDENVKAQELSVEALKQRLEELDQRAEKSARGLSPEQIEQMSEEEQQKYLLTMLLPLQQTLYYTDILVGKEPQDRSLCEQAAGRAMILGQYEHSLIHLQTCLERFPEDHALVHQRIAELQQRLALNYAEDNYDEREELYLELAEKSFFASLALEENTKVRISLAEVLLEQEDRLDEAKFQLLQAKNGVSDSDEEAHIEMHLGEIALEQEQPEMGISHFQRVTELKPDDAVGWETLGEVQQRLEHFEEAESSFKRAIELDPHEPEYYSNLGLLYRDSDRDAQAIQILKDGLAANPESIDLHLYLAGAYEISRDFRQAEDLLEKAALLDPDSELIAAFRRTLAIDKQSKLPTAPKQFKLTGPKKKKKHHH
jgi:Flp pilus assembly protein TadD